MPEVGLRVRVDLAAGKDGVNSAQGMPLISPYVLQFKTLPLLKPRLVVSQVVDDPHERFWPEVRSVAMKPFAVRVEAGLSNETELDDEVVDVKLSGPYEETVQNEEHTYYPGCWPPEVPASALKHGNAALFVVRQVARWTQQGRQAGMLTAFRYFLLVVPPGFFQAGLARGAVGVRCRWPVLGWARHVWDN